MARSWSLGMSAACRRCGTGDADALILARALWREALDSLPWAWAWGLGGEVLLKAIGIDGKWES